MKVTKFEDAKEYYQKVESYLLQNEAAHCLLIGLTKALADSSSKNGTPPYLVTVEYNGAVAATAIQTHSDRKLILSQSTRIKAINSIVKNIVSQDKSLPGVIGGKLEAMTFAHRWKSLTRQSFELDFAMKIHQLKAVKAITQASGNMRLAKESDRNLLIEWSKAFESEALGENEPKSDYELWFDRHLRQQSLFIWQDKVSVSMAAFGSATPNGVKINAVYTPPKFRGKGNATSCVAALSQYLLEQGYKYCFLFTDLANHTSNHIYQKIGYQPVCDISNYGFKLT